MGIRYDRDNRKPTNGPIILFSDASTAHILNEEVRCAINSGFSFYCYRLPNAPIIMFGSSASCVPGIGVPGFVIGMFNSELPFITIPFEGKPLSHNQPEKCYEMPRESTSKDDYFKEIKGIQENIKEIPRAKIVAARVIREIKKIETGELFFQLCNKFPDAYVFCFGTPQTGCWIGASPELLLKASDHCINTMALAGTRLKSQDYKWDEKNIEEQKIVVDYILSILNSSGLKPIPEETFTKGIGEIEHLCTPIKVPLGDNEKIDIESLLRKFSPTPALCGEPKDLALRIIKQFEAFDRGCYGGFCGPFHNNNDFTFNVVLRCASFTERVLCIYVGGGITAKSTAQSEWLETEAKYYNTFTI